MWYEVTAYKDGKPWTRLLTDDLDEAEDWAHAQKKSGSQMEVIQQHPDNLTFDEWRERDET